MGREIFGMGWDSVLVGDWGVFGLRSVVARMARWVVWARGCSMCCVGRFLRRRRTSRLLVISLGPLK